MVCTPEPRHRTQLILLSPGSIIYGGVDTKKYIGSLEKRAIIDPDLSPDGADRHVRSFPSVTKTSVLTPLPATGFT